MTRPFILLALVLATCSAQAQNPLEEYVLETRGDTLVIADFFDADGTASTLGEVIAADTDAGNVPAGRVYLLHAGRNGPIGSGDLSLYLFGAPIPEQGRPLTIVGEFCGLMVQGDDPDCRPPTMAGFEGASEQEVFATISIDDDLTLKNLHFTSATTQGSSTWSSVNVNGDGLTVRFENVLLEHNRWTWINSNDNPGTSLYVSDSYLLNATDQNSRRNGGVYDNTSTPTDVLWVENTTHVQNAGMQYRYRDFSPTQVVFNHNTFVNAAGQLFQGAGYLTNFAATNNLFVNSNYQPYYPGLDFYDFNEGGASTGALQPHGIIDLRPLATDGAGNPVVITVDSYPGTEAFDEADRKVLVDLNAAYWNPLLLTIADDLNAAGVEGEVCAVDGCVENNPSLDWTSQAILANDRTLGLFSDDETYPLLTWGTWVDAGAPGFVDGPGLVQELYDWGYDAASSNIWVDDLLPKLRQPGNEAGNEIPNEDPVNWVIFDWPVPIDLAYTNPTYREGGYNGYPLGDLNWFADEKDGWLAQRDAEYAAIAAALDAGTPLGPAAGVTSTVVDGDAGHRYFGPPAAGLTVDDLADQNLVRGVPGYYPDAPANLWTAYDAATNEWAASAGTGEALELGKAFKWMVYDKAAGNPAISASVELPFTLSTALDANAADVTVELQTDGTRFNYLANPFGTDLDLSGLFTAWPGSANLASPSGVQVYDDAARTWVDAPASVGPWVAFRVRSRGPRRPGNDNPRTLTIPASAAGAPAARSAVAAPQASARAAVTALAVESVSPNPSSSVARVSFAVPEAGPARVSVVDVRGREVAVLVDGVVSAGRHEAVLDAGRLAGGVYLIRLVAGGEVVTRQAAVVR